MENRNELVVIKTCKLMKEKVEVWGGDGEVYMTRYQIGAALEYADPAKAIGNIHAAHKERLDRYSTPLVLRGADGKIREMVLYSAKGVYEICRWSRQPKADEFYDKVYDLLEQVRKEGFYGSITKENAMRLARKAGVTMDDYAEYKTGRSLTDRVKEARWEADRVVDWSEYRISVSDVMVETGARHEDVLNVARKKKIDKNKELAKYVQGELRFTLQGLRVMRSEIRNIPPLRKTVGEPIQWTFDGSGEK